MTAEANIVMMCSSNDAADVRHAEALAKHLEVRFDAARLLRDDELALMWSGQRLELRDRESGRRGVYADLAAFDPNTLAGRGLKKQPLARAIGIEARTVIDATAGLGHDAALMALMGYEVTAIERSPIIAALLEDGVRRALEDDRIGQRIRNTLRVVCANSREYLAKVRLKPDVIYIDPMFPPKRKASALARKSIRLVRAVVGDDPDAMELVCIAREVARQRVVVKRPSNATSIVPEPTTTIEGTVVRYDVYRI